MGGIFSSIGKIVKAAIPVAISYATGGPVSAALTAAGQVAGMAQKQPKASAVTGVTAAATDTTAASQTQTAEQAAEEEKKKRLALNAAGASGNTTSPLGVTSGATVTKRNLLGL